MCLNEYHTTYPNYFNANCQIHDKYIYGSINNWLIVYKKPSLFGCKTNESRPNIYDDNCATYLANKLKVIIIIDKFVCSITIKSIQIDHFDEIINIKTGHTIKPKTWLQFYKSYEVAYYQNIPIPNRTIKYTGHHKSWYDNGMLSSEGDYLNGEKNGTWIYRYSNVIKKVEYLNGNIV